MKSSKSDVTTNALKQGEQVKYVLPFFERGIGAEPIGTSDIFYLKLKKAEDIASLEKMADKLGVQVIEEIPYTSGWYTLSILGSDFGSSIEASNFFFETGQFEDVDPAFMFDFKPSATYDPRFGDQWGLRNTTYASGIDINVIPAWEITRGAGIKVAVVDTPIMSNHSDLDNNFYSSGYNAMLKRTPSASWVSGASHHGTHVAGIIAAEKNGSQVMGVAYESKIMRVSHNIEFTSTISSELAAGINWAWQNGADVINCSWGDRDGNHIVHMEMHSTLLESAIINAMTQGRGGKGSVVVFAAGNSGTRGAIVNYPGNFNSSILTVGAIDNTGYRASFSGYGQSLDVVAPGVNILSTTPTSSPNYDSGTSFAAPHVSGIAALILSVNPNLKQYEVVSAIERSASGNQSWNNQTGYGLVNAHKAIMSSFTITGLDYPNLNTNVTYSASPPPSGVTFNGWTITPASYTVTGGTSSTNLNIKFTAQTTYTLTARYTSNGTTHSITKTVKTTAPTLSSISFSPSPSVLGGDYVTFTANGDVDGATFEWIAGSGTVAGTGNTAGNTYYVKADPNAQYMVVYCRAKRSGLYSTQQSARVTIR